MQSRSIACNIHIGAIITKLLNENKMKTDTKNLSKKEKEQLNYNGKY